MVESRYLYKAKRIDRDQWVQGAYLSFDANTSCIGHKQDIKHYIIKDRLIDWNLPKEIQFIEVDGNTVCQCTGFRDVNNNLIWEHDLFHADFDNEIEKAEVIWNEEYLQWSVQLSGMSEEWNGLYDEIMPWHDEYPLTDYFQDAVIGNIFDTEDSKINKESE